MVRVRFAPSPTGFLHVGGARTALFNWLFARNKGGKFLLRIEDTDVERSEREMVDYIFESLKWLGLDWDEEPIFQSERLELYKKIAQELVEKGYAYYCYTPQGREECIEIKAEEVRGKKVAIKFRVPDEGETVFEDLIRGKVSFRNRDIEDFVILKSDGFPTYQLACVVDDHYLEITHVIRGEDHIPNTPKQILIYKALSWTPPEFAHLPMILGPDRKKLSKRHGATAVLEYREMGFLPEALFNFLALLGWSPGGDREILPKDEMISLFDLKRVGKSAAVFDMEKLMWMNGEYVRKKSDEELFQLTIPFFERENLIKDEADKELVRKIIPLLKERVRLLKDFVSLGDYFLREVKYEREAVEKHLGEPVVFERLGELKRRLEEIREEDFTKDQIESVIRGLAQEMGIKAKELIHPVRVAVTGKTVGPGLFELMEVLGREKVLKRIERSIDEFGKSLGGC
jgi:glutamyl-tRNA synthetase